MPLERRRSKRIQKPLMVQYLEPGSTTQWDTTEAKNISSQGLMITTSSPFEANSTMHLRIKVPLNPFRWLEFDARVVECGKESTGVDYNSRGTFYRLRLEITKISEENKNMIREYIEWYLRKEKDTYIPGAE